MKKLYFSLFFFISLTLVFTVIVFFSNLSPFALEQKSYFEKFKSLREYFHQELDTIEKNIYEDFLSQPYHLTLLRSIMRKGGGSGDNIEFTKNKYLLNFSVIDSKKKILYQIESKSYPFLDNFDFKKKNFITDNNIIFQIPFENLEQKFFLIFEFDTSSFLKQAFTDLEEYRENNILHLPQTLILNTKEQLDLNRDDLEKAIKAKLEECSILKRFCNLYISGLQKRLIIDKSSYLNYSAGFLYTSNPLDVPQLSIIIFIALFFLITLNACIILINILRKKTIPSQELASQTSSKESIDERPETNIAIDQRDPVVDKNQAIMDDEEDIEMDLEKIPNFDEDEIEDRDITPTPSTEDETVSEEIPEVAEESYSQAPLNPIDKEITDLHQEINQPPQAPQDVEADEDSVAPEEVLMPENEPSDEEPSEQVGVAPTLLKQEYHDFSFELVKTFFPERKPQETDELLRKFPNANSLLLLKLEGKIYNCEQGLFSDPETINQCHIAFDDYIVTQYLQHKKGVLISKSKENLQIIKPWLSESQLAKTQLVFIFPLNYKEDKYIFILY